MAVVKKLEAENGMVFEVTTKLCITGYAFENLMEYVKEHVEDLDENDKNFEKEVNYEIGEALYEWRSDYCNDEQKGLVIYSTDEITEEIARILKEERNGED